MKPFGERLYAAMEDRGPLCAGVDPHPALLDAWGQTDSATGLERFALTATEALAPHVAVVKPQSAFFERHGSAGVAVLERVIATAREAGALVLLDVKRGDIGSTTQAYADAYLDPRSPLAADAMTASPYLGFHSLDPLLETARAHDAGVFVLALTSNPEAPQVQHARTPDGTVAGEVLASLRELNAGEEHGSFGAVVGATIGETEEDLDVGGPLLVPGVGAQGGTPESVRRIFGTAVHRVLPASSREILAAGPAPAALVATARATADAYAALLT
ncbi:orotidine-5'-phosphate decarboxylase [Nocardioides mangrovicus]|uniref:Orotidine 5'-phosphate decarboxylase n=1 Tax=Nocardioides mangrovicus TaxID=2478913 RepID=A0A3L8P4X2_9ACTN|nr:orotidine-5'-phosphate decarboxylase [Nocardioides mangrovicus]RLV50221.1 orotidine-5'-phosphate decarboxylase [Nocardioides mangrovicus]